GLVGVGTSNPIAKLTVNGDLSVGTSATISGVLNVGNSGFFSYGVGITGNLMVGSSGLFQSNVGITGNLMVGSSGLFQSNVGITGNLEVNGNANIGTTITSNTDISSIFLDKENNNYFLNPADAGPNSSALNLYATASIRFNTYGVGNTFIVANAAASRLLNFTNGLLLDVGNTGSANTAITWPGNQLFLNTSGNVGIGTTSPAYKLDVNGEIRTTSNLVEKKVIFTPSTVGWYRIISNTASGQMGGTIRISAAYDNTVTDPWTNHHIWLWTKYAKFCNQPRCRSHCGCYRCPDINLGSRLSYYKRSNFC
ncbi:MAG: hypothetical protein NTY75_03435, partial [Candidatus Shapirobacteria bacterium]|nr:hypothetical protein [Candidatus Shapirobacteria bacterium]